MYKTVFTAPNFSPGKTYVYKYEVSLMTGLPEEGLGKAGVYGNCKFLISAIDQNTFMLKVKSKKGKQITFSLKY